LDSVFLKEAPSYDQHTVDDATEFILHHCFDGTNLTSKSRVVLKVNLLMKSHPDNAVTTHPAVVSGVIKYLKSKRVKEIIIADSSAGLFTASRLKGIYDGCGMTALVQDGVSLNFDLSSVECISAQNHRYNILRVIKEADIVIGIAKLKTHMMTGISATVKNYFGVIPGLEKAEFHSRFPNQADFCRMICDLYECLNPDISLLDAVMGMEGNGPSGGSPRNYGFIAGGKNGHCVDRVACHLIGIAPDKNFVLKKGIELGVAPENMTDVTVEGDTSLLSRPLAGVSLPETYSAGLAVVLPGFLQPLGNKILNRLITPTPVVRKKNCIGCARCAETCPQKVITINDKVARINPKNCIRCYCCHEVCPERAIDIKKTMLVKAVN
jgi:Uncharacterized conserved protein